MNIARSDENYVTFPSANRDTLRIVYSVNNAQP
jgi:hypothetical protein